MKSGVVALIVTAGMVSQAHALEISETMVERFVNAQFPKTLAGVRVTAPKIRLLDGKAEFCALARPILFFKDVEFCTKLVPLWRQETGSLHGTDMSLVSLNLPGIPEKYIESTRTLVNDIILPRLDGTEIYKADNLIGKSVSAIKVKPGKVDLSF